MSNDSCSAIQMYLQLMKKCLLDQIHDHGSQLLVQKGSSPKNLLRTLIIKRLGAKGVRLVRLAGKEAVETGATQPAFAHTMVGMKRLDNIQYCVESVLKDRVAGDLIETGVWRGGSCIFMRSILKAHEVTDRTVWVADSFRGLPEADEKAYPQDKGDTHHKEQFLAVSVDQVKENFRKYDLLDAQVKFLVGWFKDTLPTAPIDRLAVLRLDGDMYGSTMDALNSLYPKLSAGGYVIVDDYSFINCRKAIDDFRSAHGIRDEVKIIDQASAYWRRGA